MNESSHPKRLPIDYTPALGIWAFPNSHPKRLFSDHALELGLWNTRNNPQAVTQRLRSWAAVCECMQPVSPSDCSSITPLTWVSENPQPRRFFSEHALDLDEWNNENVSYTKTVILSRVSSIASLRIAWVSGNHHSKRFFSDQGLGCLSIWK